MRLETKDLPIQMVSDVLRQTIIDRGEISPDGAILRVKDLNRTVDVGLIRLVSDSMVYWIRATLGKIDKENMAVVVVESSGNMLAGFVADRLNLPVVIIKKGRPKTMFNEVISKKIHSFTRKEPTTISVERNDIAGKGLIGIDDFAATGETLEALESMAQEAQARMLAVAVAVSKPEQGSASILSRIPSLSVVRIEEMVPAKDGMPATIKFAGRPPQSLKRTWGEG